MSMITSLLPFLRKTLLPSIIVVGILLYWIGTPYGYAAEQGIVSVQYLNRSTGEQTTKIIEGTESSIPINPADQANSLSLFVVAPQGTTIQVFEGTNAISQKSSLVDATITNIGNNQFTGKYIPLTLSSENHSLHAKVFQVFNGVETVVKTTEIVPLLIDRTNPTITVKNNSKWSGDQAWVNAELRELYAQVSDTGGSGINQNPSSVSYDLYDNTDSISVKKNGDSIVFDSINSKFLFIPEGGIDTDNAVRNVFQDGHTYTLSFIIEDNAGNTVSGSRSFTADNADAPGNLSSATQYMKDVIGIYDPNHPACATDDQCKAGGTYPGYMPIAYTQGVTMGTSADPILIYTNPTHFLFQVDTTGAFISPWQNGPGVVLFHQWGIGSTFETHPDSPWTPINWYDEANGILRTSSYEYSLGQTIYTRFRFRDSAYNRKDNLVKAYLKTAEGVAGTPPRPTITNPSSASKINGNIIPTISGTIPNIGVPVTVSVRSNNQTSNGTTVIGSIEVEPIEGQEELSWSIVPPEGLSMPTNGYWDFFPKAILGSKSSDEANIVRTFVDTSPPALNSINIEEGEMIKKDEKNTIFIKASDLYFHTAYEHCCFYLNFNTSKIELFDQENILIGSSTNGNWKSNHNSTYELLYPLPQTLTDGQYRAKITLVDAFGNTTIEERTFFIDSTAPVISLKNQKGEAISITSEAPLPILKGISDLQVDVEEANTISLDPAKTSIRIWRKNGESWDPLGTSGIKLVEEEPGKYSVSTKGVVFSEGIFEYSIIVSDTVGNISPEIRGKVNITPMDFSFEKEVFLLSAQGTTEILSDVILLETGIISGQSDISCSLDSASSLNQVLINGTICQKGVTTIVAPSYSFDDNGGKLSLSADISDASANGITKARFFIDNGQGLAGSTFLTRSPISFAENTLFNISDTSEIFSFITNPILLVKKLLPEQENTVPASEDLKASWTFNNYTNPWEDSKNENDALPQGSPINTEGKFGKDALFNGTTDFLQVDGTSLDFTGQTELSLSIWVRTSQQNGVILEQSNANDPLLRTMRLALENGNAVFDLINHTDGSRDSVASFNTINNNSWHQITVNISEETIDLLIDGNTVSSSSVAKTSSTFLKGGNIFIGASSNGQDLFSGELDEIHIWNRTLSTEEIESLYNQTKNGLGEYQFLALTNENTVTVESDIDGIIANQDADQNTEGIQIPVNENGTITIQFSSSAVASDDIANMHIFVSDQPEIDTRFAVQRWKSFSKGSITGITENEKDIAQNGKIYTQTPVFNATLFGKNDANSSRITYEIEFAKDEYFLNSVAKMTDESAFTDVVDETTPINFEIPLSTSSPIFDTNGTYYARVRSKDEIGRISRWSDPFPFVYEKQFPPLIPQNLLVKDNAGEIITNESKTSKTSIEFNFDIIDNNKDQLVGYQMEWSTDNLFTAPVVVEQNPSGEQGTFRYTINNLSAREYYWRVKAIDEISGESQYSTIKHFTIVIPAPYGPFKQMGRTIPSDNTSLTLVENGSCTPDKWPQFFFNTEDFSAIQPGLPQSVEGTFIVHTIRDNECRASIQDRVVGECQVTEGENEKDLVIESFNTSMNDEWVKGVFRTTDKKNIIGYFHKESLPSNVKNSFESFGIKNDGNGHLSGKAWSIDYGWISFAEGAPKENCETPTAFNDSQYEVCIDGEGKFRGYAKILRRDVLKAEIEKIFSTDDSWKDFFIDPSQEMLKFKRSVKTETFQSIVDETKRNAILVFWNRSGGYLKFGTNDIPEEKQIKTNWKSVDQISETPTIDGIEYEEIVGTISNNPYLGSILFSKTIDIEAKVSREHGIIGKVWSTGGGWINLDSDGKFGSSNTGEDYGIVVAKKDENEAVHFSGRAWGEGIGWIEIARGNGIESTLCEQVSEPENGAENFGICVDKEGFFHGYAWSENFGWIPFEGLVITNLNTSGYEFVISSDKGFNEKLTHHYTVLNSKPGTQRVRTETFLKNGLDFGSNGLDKTYYWKVRSIVGNNTGSSDWAPIPAMSLKICAKAPSVEIISPENNSDICSLPEVGFQIQENNFPQQKVKYNVTYSNSNTGSIISVQESPPDDSGNRYRMDFLKEYGDQTNIANFSLKNKSSINVKVNVENEVGKKTESDSITLHNKYITPSLITPENDARITRDTNLEFSVEGIAGVPYSAEIEVRTENSGWGINDGKRVFFGKIEETNPPTTKSHKIKPTGLPPGKTMYWRVLVSNGSCSIASETRSFSIVSGPPVIEKVRLYGDNIPFWNQENDSPTECIKTTRDPRTLYRYTVSDDSSRVDISIQLTKNGQLFRKWETSSEYPFGAKDFLTPAADSNLPELQKPLPNENANYRFQISGRDSDGENSNVVEGCFQFVPGEAIGYGNIGTNNITAPLGHEKTEHRKAWNDKVSWIDFNPPLGGVHIEKSRVYGYAYNSTISWIRFYCGANRSAFQETDNMYQIDDEADAICVNGNEYGVVPGILEEKEGTMTKSPGLVDTDGSQVLLGKAYIQSLDEFLYFDPLTYAEDANLEDMNWKKDNDGNIQAVQIDQNGYFSGFAWSPSLGWVNMRTNENESLDTVFPITEYRPNEDEGPEIEKVIGIYEADDTQKFIIARAKEGKTMNCNDSFVSFLGETSDITKECVNNNTALQITVNGGKVAQKAGEYIIEGYAVDSSGAITDISAEDGIILTIIANSEPAWGEGKGSFVITPEIYNENEEYQSSNPDQILSNDQDRYSIQMNLKDRFGNSIYKNPSRDIVDIRFAITNRIRSDQLSTNFEHNAISIQRNSADLTEGTDTIIEFEKNEEDSVMEFSISSIAPTNTNDTAWIENLSITVHSFAVNSNPDCKTDEGCTFSYSTQNGEMEIDEDIDPIDTNFQFKPIFSATHTFNEDYDENEPENIVPYTVKLSHDYRNKSLNVDLAFMSCLNTLPDNTNVPFVLSTNTSLNPSSPDCYILTNENTATDFFDTAEIAKFEPENTRKDFKGVSFGLELNGDEVAFYSQIGSGRSGDVSGVKGNCYIAFQKPSTNEEDVVRYNICEENGGVATYSRKTILVEGISHGENISEGSISNDPTSFFTNIGGVHAFQDDIRNSLYRSLVDLTREIGGIDSLKPTTSNEIEIDSDTLKQWLEGNLTSFENNDINILSNDKVLWIKFKENSGDNLVVIGTPEEDDERTEDIDPIFTNTSKTIIVEGGSVEIQGNIVTAGQGVLGIIALRKTDQRRDDNWLENGNVYIDHNVTNIRSVIFAEGSVFSSDRNDNNDALEIIDGKTLERELILNNQLSIYGSIISQNTFGLSGTTRGSLSDSAVFHSETFDKDDIEIQKTEATRFDLMKLREFTRTPSNNRFFDDTDGNGVKDDLQDISQCYDEEGEVSPVPDECKPTRPVRVPRNNGLAFYPIHSNFNDCSVTSFTGICPEYLNREYWESSEERNTIEKRLNSTPLYFKYDPNVVTNPPPGITQNLSRIIEE
jgi:hypothetical protein